METELEDFEEREMGDREYENGYVNAEQLDDFILIMRRFEKSHCGD